MQQNFTFDLCLEFKFLYLFLTEVEKSYEKAFTVLSVKAFLIFSNLPWCIEKKKNCTYDQHLILFFMPKRLNLVNLMSLSRFCAKQKI